MKERDNHFQGVITRIRTFRETYDNLVLGNPAEIDGHEIPDFDTLDEYIQASSSHQIWLWDYALKKGNRKTDKFRIYLADVQESDFTVPEIYLQGYKDLTHEVSMWGWFAETARDERYLPHMGDQELLTWYADQFVPYIT